MSQLPNVRVRPWRVGRVYAGRPAGQDEARWVFAFDFVDGGSKRQDFAIDLRLAYAPRDQLSVLAAEIQNDNHLFPHSYSLRFLEDFSFMLNRRRDYNFRLLKLFNIHRADCSHAGSERPHQILRSVIGARRTV